MGGKDGVHDLIGSVCQSVDTLDLTVSGCGGVGCSGKIGSLSVQNIPQAPESRYPYVRLH